MDSENNGFFWPSYLDLMVSLFFVMLILFVFSFFHYYNKIDELEKYKQVNETEKEKIEDLKRSIDKLMNDRTFFIYEEEYKRYKLAQDIEFYFDKYKIDKLSIRTDFENTIVQLKNTGLKLKTTLDELLKKKHSDSLYANISYTLIITGRASTEGEINHNYELSYKRAYYLYTFWKENVVDFDSPEYQEIIDLQISGVGEGGLARIPIFDQSGIFTDNLNRCFFIQIIPKIGELKNQIDD